MGSMMGAMSIWHILLFTYFRGDLISISKILRGAGWNGWLSEHH
jgi:hypothetical protein